MPLLSHRGLLLKPPGPPPLLLDIYPSAAGAYSVRKLRTAYVGNCLRVVTSAAGNAEQDIGFDINGNLDETALSTFIGANTGTVKTWYDQSGSSMDLTQTTLAKQPIIVNAGTLLKLNTKMTVLGDGTNDIMSSAFNNSGSTTIKKVTSALIVKSGRTSATECMFGIRRANSFMYQAGHQLIRRTTALNISLGTGDVGVFNTALIRVDQAANSNISTLMALHGIADGPGNVERMYYDGVSQTLTNFTGTMAVSSFLSTTGTNHQNVLFGEIDRANAETSWFQGNISEAIMWPDTQLLNIAGIKANQSAYFGTP